MKLFILLFPAVKSINNNHLIKKTSNKNNGLLVSLVWFVQFNSIILYGKLL